MLALTVLVVVLVQRIATQATPALSFRRTVGAYVRVAGNAPALAWPREGEAAVEVTGVGSLGGSGSAAPVPIASVAKVMTAYLTLLEHPLPAHGSGFVLRITPGEVAEQGERVELGESTVPVRAGERIDERQALQALLLPSANNMAAILATYDAGSLSGFVARMNATAKRLGMTSTTYTDPSGFQPTTVSTAIDQLKLARMAMRVPAFAEIVGEHSAVLPVAGRVTNYNGLVGEEGYAGVKTGSDGAAGGCLVFAKRVTLDGRRLTVLGAVLGQHWGAPIEAALASARALGNSAAEALRPVTVLPAGASVLRAGNVDGGKATVATTAPLRTVGWGGLVVALGLRARTNVDGLRAGERVATVSVRNAGGSAVDAVAGGGLGGPSLGWRLGHLF